MGLGERWGFMVAGHVPSADSAGASSAWTLMNLVSFICTLKKHFNKRSRSYQKRVVGWNTFLMVSERGWGLGTGSVAGATQLPAPRSRRLRGQQLHLADGQGSRSTQLALPGFPQF